MRFITHVLIIILCVSLCACAQTRATRTLIYKDRDLKVELCNEAGGDFAPMGYSHPRVFDKTEVKFLLGSIKYQQKSLFTGWTDAKAVFSAHELYIITPHIVDAFSKASSEDEVAFSSNVPKSGTFLAQDRYTDGVMFIQDGKLNCAFANINIRADAADPSDATYPHDGNPKEISAGGLSRLLPVAWQSLHVSDKGIHDNWIEIDIEQALEEKAAVEKAFQVQRKKRKKRELRRIRESVEWEEWNVDTPVETE